jgi:hypothetical protein
MCVGSMLTRKLSREMSFLAVENSTPGIALHTYLALVGNSAPYCKKDPIYVLPEMKLRGLVPNFHFHESVSDLYIPTIVPPICCRNIDGPIVEIYKSLTYTVHECGNWEQGFISGNICFEFSVQYVCSAG